MSQADVMNGSPNERKRGWGEGTIVERAGRDGTVKFLAQLWVNGRRVAKTHAARPEAQRWIRRTLSDGERGITPTDEGKWTVAKFLESWLDAKRASLKPKSMEDYTWAVRRHLAPGLAKLKLADLRGNHLQTLYGKELAAGLSPRSVHHLHRVVHNALDDAVLWDYVPRNVADAVIPPKPPRTENSVWTPEQARSFIAGVAGERYEAIYVLAITCGLRVGEMCGLKWEDIDLDAATLQVQRTRQRIRTMATDGGPKSHVVDGAPKTKKGARLIVLPPLTVSALRRWRTRQKQERLIAGPTWQDTGYVFTYQLGTPIEPGDFHTAFVAVAKRLGLPRIRPHDLRHTCATVLLGQNVNPKIVQEMLGHSQITVTMDLYSHVLPAMHQEAARTMERVFGAG